MPLIICKVELSFKWTGNCVLTTAAIGANANAKLYIPIVTLSAEDNAKLTKLLGEGFKRYIYWNKRKVTDDILVQIAAQSEEKYIRERLDASYQGVKRLFVFAYDNTADDNDNHNQVSIDSFKKYFLPRVKIENYNIEIDGRNFYDQSINDSIKKYDEIRKISSGQGDDYTTGCF